jgi:hypothetical protein
VVTFGPFAFDLGARTLRKNGEELPLTTGEFAMLKALVRHPRQPLSREKLAQLARGREFEPFDRSLDVQVSRLRKLVEWTPRRRATSRRSGAWATCSCRMARAELDLLTGAATHRAVVLMSRATVAPADARGPAPGDHPRRWRAPRAWAVSLFWRTFFLLALLLVGSILAWLQTCARWSSSRARCRRRSRSPRWST